ncbi:MAG: GNAT family N-acetyltransferase [Candidatus Thorarchaeota archaeon]|jgi:amino-acid N-acetyltransferase
MSIISEIEIATFEDLEGIVELLESVNVPTEGIDPDFTRFFVYRDTTNDKIIGCIGLELFTDTALLRSFAIDPNHQGNNLGHSLVNRLLEEAVEAGSEAVYVCTAKVPSFFWSIGFASIDLDDVPDEIRNSGLFKGGCPRIAAYMMKRAV